MSRLFFPLGSLSSPFFFLASYLSVSSCQRNRRHRHGDVIARVAHALHTERIDLRPYAPTERSLQDPRANPSLHPEDVGGGVDAHYGVPSPFAR